MAGKGGKGIEKSLTVSDYSRQFFERTVNRAYADEASENQKLADANFVNLIRKLHDAGSRDDIKVPLRVLRDEIGRIYFGSSKQRSEKIECLFKLYDALEAAAQADLRAKDGKTAAAAAHTLDELRQRFSRLVIGDTWEAWPELKLAALKRMHAYALREGQALKEAAIASPPPTPSAGARLGMRKLSRTFSGAAGGSGGAQWQAAIDDLGKAPGARLLPLIKLLLLDNADLPQEAKEGLAAEATAAANGGAPAGKELSSQPSGVSEAAEAGRRVAELNMDDLLGLSDITEEEPTPSPQAQDPFQVAPSSQSNGVQLQPPPQQQQQQQQAPRGSSDLPRQGSYAQQQPQPQQQQLPSQGSWGQPPQQLQTHGSYGQQPQPQQQLQSQGSYQQPQPQQQLQTQGSFGQQPQQLQSKGSYGQQPPPPQQQLHSQGSFGQPNGRRSGDGGFAAPRSPHGGGGSSGGPPGGFYGQPGQAQGQQGVQAFERNAFGSQTAFPQPQGVVPQHPAGSYPPIAHQTSGGLPTAGSGQPGSGGGGGGGFNPFGLPSPTYASALPPGADNSFAAFSPVAAAPPQPVPQPMRAPPQPPTGAYQQQQQQPPQQQGNAYGGW